MGSSNDSTYGTCQRIKNGLLTLKKKPVKKRRKCCVWVFLTSGMLRANNHCHGSFARMD